MKIKYSQRKLQKKSVDYWVTRIKKGERPVIKVIRTKEGLVIDDGNHRYKAYQLAKTSPKIKIVQNKAFKEQIDTGVFKVWERTGYWD